MKLYLSRNSPLNATLVDELGQELYYIHTPWKLSGRTTTITKADKELEAFVKFGGLLISDSKSDISPSDDSSTRGQPELAKIHWRCIGNSRLNFGGFERDIHEYLVRTGFMGWCVLVSDHETRYLNLTAIMHAQVSYLHSTRWQVVQMDDGVQLP